MYDSIERVKNSDIHHGSQNSRIYLMHLTKDDVPEIFDVLNQMAKVHGYTKIIAKVPESVSDLFLKNGYVSEAVVPRFFSGAEDCMFMSKFMEHKRSEPNDKELNQKVLETAFLKAPVEPAVFEKNKLDQEFVLRKAVSFDGDRMVELYSRVFESYPFPIFHSDYIKKTMENHVVYFGIWKGDEILALSSCEMSDQDENVEMTDFAVHPDYRGYRFAYYLLVQMEKEMKKYNRKTAYTIARSCSFGMNHTFARFGYKFSGVLVKNTQIGGTIEDMNVWYKHL